MLAIDSGFVVKEKEYVILLLYVNTADICDRSYNLYSCCCHRGDSGFYDWNNRQCGGNEPIKIRIFERSSGQFYSATGYQGRMRKAGITFFDFLSVQKYLSQLDTVGNSKRNRKLCC